MLAKLYFRTKAKFVYLTSQVDNCQLIKYARHVFNNSSIIGFVPKNNEKCSQCDSAGAISNISVSSICLSCLEKSQQAFIVDIACNTVSFVFYDDYSFIPKKSLNFFVTENYNF